MTAKPATANPAIRPIDTGTDKLVATVDGAVGRIVLNNPERHNAISGAMFAGFGDAADAFAAMPEVRVVVVEGAGDRAFASGADIGGLDEKASRPSGLPALAALDIPVVAAIRGYCIGGGLMTALYADIRIASDDAVFGIPAAKLGVGYPYEAASMLVDTVGESRAKEILLLGDRYDASQALGFGLVQRVVGTDELAATIDAVTATLAANAPLSMAASKASIAAATGKLDQSSAQAAIAATWGSEDFAEGRAAFGEKRPPRFVGR